MNKFKFTKFFKHKGMNFHTIKYGKWAIQTTTYGIISSKHVKFIKQYLQKHIKKFKFFKFNITLNKVVTKKPLDTRMGGGKGTIYDLQYFLKPGSIIFEVYNIPLNILLPIFQIINNKIPIKIRLLSIN